MFRICYNLSPFFPILCRIAVERQVLPAGAGKLPETKPAKGAGSLMSRQRSGLVRLDTRLACFALSILGLAFTLTF
jgi:hypothetical protein